MMFNIVHDLIINGAVTAKKSKPAAHTFESLIEDFESSYDNIIGDGVAPSSHECLKGRRVIPYMDFDEVLKDVKAISDANARKKYEDNFLKEIGQDVKEVFGKGAKITIATRSGLSQSHNAYKISYRVYIRGAGYFDSSEHCGEYMALKFPKYFGTTLDKAPYSAAPNMGMLFNTKHGDPRILEPLIKAPRVSWAKAVRTKWEELSEEKRAELLKATIIQNTEGESICLNIPDSKVGQKRETSTIYFKTLDDGTEVFSDNIEKTLSYSRKLMPNLEIRSIKEKEDGSDGKYILVEFMKNSDECAVCKYAHKNNRAYAIVYDSAAYLKCHKAGREKKVSLYYSQPNILIPNNILYSFLPKDMDEDSDQSSDDESDFIEIAATRPNNINIPPARNVFRAFNEFLSTPEYINPKGVETTNIVDMYTQKCYHIPDDKIPKYFEFLEICRRKKLKCMMYEKQGMYSGIMLDFDFKLTAGGDAPPVDDTHYNSLCVEVFKILSKYIDLNNGNFHIGFTKEPKIIYDPEHDYYKYGIYMIIPSIQITIGLKKLIIDNIISSEVLERVFENVTPHDSITRADFIDKDSSYGSSFFIGSASKINTPPYELDAVYEVQYTEVLPEVRRVALPALQNICYEFSLNWAAPNGFIQKKRFDARPEIIIPADALAPIAPVETTSVVSVADEIGPIIDTLNIKKLVNKDIDTANKIITYIMGKLDDGRFNDTMGAEMLIMAAKTTLVISGDSGDGFQYNDKTALWEPRYKTDIANSIPKQLGPYVDAVYKKLVAETPNIDSSKLKQHNTNIKNINQFITRNLESVSNYTNILKAARTRLMDEKFSSKLNKNPDLMPVMGCRVVDLRTGLARPRTKADMFSFECPVNYIDNPPTNAYDNVNRLMNGIFLDNAELINYMRQRLGMMITGRIIREFDLWYGDGRNGKSTLCEIMAGIMGQYYSGLRAGVFINNNKLSASQKSEHTSHLMPLDGIRIGICHEIDRGASLNAGLLKELSAGNEIKVRGAYEKNEKTIKPFVKLILCSNHKPIFDSDDQGICDRIQNVPFMGRFVNNPRPNTNERLADTQFIEMMMGQAERDNMFMWLLGGAGQFYKNNMLLTTPKSIEEAKQSAINDNDIVSNFLEDVCVTIKPDDFEALPRNDKKIYMIDVNTLNDRFNRYIMDNQSRAQPRGFLAKRLEQLGYTQQNTGGIRSFKRIQIAQRGPNYHTVADPAESESELS